MQKCKLIIELHKSIKDHTFFNSVKEISITRPELFKHGIMFWETPEHIKDTDFEHLQSKVPAIDQLIGDSLELTNDQIINKSNDDIAKKIISQVIGVGTGLIYFGKLLKVNPNRITKVPPPQKKGKYMDYQVSKDGRAIEFEAKGTISESSIETKVKDILAKKSNSSASFKLGTVVVARNSNEKTPSRLIVCDDPPPDSFVENNPAISEVIFHYLDYLSFVMDNVQYNKFYKRLFKAIFRPPRITLKKLRAKYSYNGTDYLGQYFDRRLVIDNIHKLYHEDSNIERLFKALTNRIGSNKYFLGIDKAFLEKYNTQDWEGITNYSKEAQFVVHGHGFVLIDKDGVILVKSVAGYDSQIETTFTDQEVMKRLSQYVSFTERKWHRCGAPCRSREKEGKPCEIKTYREHCHFHR